MSVKKKVFVILTSLSTALIILTAAVFHVFTIKNIQKLEKRNAVQSVEKVIEILKEEVSNVESVCADWAYWNDAFDFIKDQNEDFKKQNLSYYNFSILRVNTLIFVDLNCNIIYDKSYDFSSGAEIKTPEELKKNIYKDCYMLDYKDDKKGVSGIIMVKERPMVFSSMPVTNVKGNRGGSIIMARFIDTERIKWINNVVDAAVDIKLAHPPEKNSEISIFEFKEMKIQSNINNNRMSGHAFIKDQTNSNELHIVTENERVIYTQFINSYRFFIFLVLIGLIIVTLLFIKIFQKVLLSRIEKLFDFINNIKSIHDIKSRVKIEGNDEISSLAQVTNLMLNEIKKSNEKMLQDEERLRLVIEGTNDGFWDFNTITQEIFISSHISEILGISKTNIQINIKYIKGILPRQFIKEFKKAYVRLLKNKSDNVLVIETKLEEKSSETKWVSIKGRIVRRDDDGKPLRLAGIVSDITEKKNSEETIKYLSEHDVLTGLLNRASFNKELERIDKKENLPLSIIQCDANGLKLTNDAFGHKQGDQLLISVSNILKSACGCNAIISRLGGDEFAIILPKTDESQAKEVMNKIIRCCEEAEANPIKPSLALGCITKNFVHEDMDKLFDIAEERMYKNKLLQNKSARHSIVASLERSLLETDFETRAHTARLQELAVRLGKSINLSHDKLDELALLGNLHDIGKIAIPKTILSKPGPLNEEEWETIKKHCEIGYRIAVSAIELMPIAEEILYHHEKWDGSGYPKGLKGEEIPLLSRIVAIVDAYDVITNSRPYKKALTHEEAIKEIIRCSGTHFDPDLVKKFVELFNEENINEKKA